MKIAVTGSTGFIGSSLVERLREENHHIIEIARSKGVDILNKEQLLNVGDFDIMIHLAAQTFVPESYNNPGSYFQNNIIGTLNCLDLCRERGSKLIYLSSYVYGQPQYLPTDEEHKTEFWNPYAASKLTGEDLCRTYFKNFKVNTLILRVFNVYGTGQSNKFLIPKIISGVKSGTLSLENMYTRRDFIFIDDLTNLISKIVKYNFYFDIFNVGYGQNFSVEEIVEKVNSIYGTSVVPDINIKKRENEVVETLADIEKVKSYFGWQPLVSLDEGLKKMIENEQ